VIGVFLLLSGIILQINAVKYITHAPANTEQSPAVSATQEPVEKMERITSPKALLVLDTSGSMKVSDRSRLQGEAVLRLYDIYNKISKEILNIEKGEKAHIALVLFSTIPQIVDWDGNGSIWLEVEGTEKKGDHSRSQKFRKAVADYLGNVQNDPRSGQKTDYLLAFREIGALTKDLTNPPLVIFMTDGLNDPHPYFIDLVSEAELLKLPGYEIHRQTIAEFKSGNFRYLNVADSEPGIIFDTKTKKLPSIDIPKQWQPLIGQAIDRTKSDFLNKTFYFSQTHPNVPLFYAPIFLNYGMNASSYRAARTDLAPQKDFWHKTNDIFKCEGAEELTKEFIYVLGKWLNLREFEIPRGALNIQIPKDTKAFAVELQMEKKCDSVSLQSKSENIPLSGRENVWAGVGKGDGTWTIQSSCGSPLRGKIFLRPRHEWMLLTPVREKNGQIKVSMCLYSHDADACVYDKKVYDALPQTLPLSVTIEGLATRTLSMTTDDGHRSNLYSAIVPAVEKKGGKVKLSVNLTSMKEFGIPAFQTHIEKEFELLPLVTIDFRDFRGKETGIEITNVPQKLKYYEEIYRRFRDIF
jgi:hypothetical protein